MLSSNLSDRDALVASLSKSLKDTKSRKLSTAKLVPAFESLRSCLDQIELLVYQSVTYCENCRATKQELIDLKLLVDELTDIKDKISTVHEQQEQLASASDDIMKENLDIQHNTLQQFAGIRQAIDAKVPVSRTL
jgi:hypothetical protein